MGRMAENRDTVEMKWKAAIEIIENMKNNHTEEEEARIRERERDIEAGRHLLKEEKKIAPDEERERMEAVQREIHMLDDDDQIMKQKRKEDFDKEVLRSRENILDCQIFIFCHFFILNMMILLLFCSVVTCDNSSFRTITPLGLFFFRLLFGYIIF